MERIDRGFWNLLLEQSYLSIQAPLLFAMACLYLAIESVFLIPVGSIASLAPANSEILLKETLMVTKEEEISYQLHHDLSLLIGTYINIGKVD